VGRARSLGSTQQSVCPSCHDGHLSCPQSVWEESFSSLEKREREGERAREEKNGKGEEEELGRTEERGEDGREGL